MTDEQGNASAAADAGKGAGDANQSDTSALAANLEKEVQEAAGKQQREAQRVSLDSFKTPEDRELAKAYAARAINEQREKALKEGKLFTPEAVEALIRDQFKIRDAEAEARVKYREHLVDLGIRTGTPDFEAFVKEANSGFYDKSKLGERALVERIAQAAKVGQFKPKETMPEGGKPYLPSGGVSVRADVASGQTQVPPDIAWAEAELARLSKK